MTQQYPSEPHRLNGVERLTILFVQPDNPADSGMLTALNLHGHGLVAWERDLRRARKTLTSIAFDLVVTDEELPDGSGLSLVAAQTNGQQRWATILLTEHTDPRHTASMRERGAAAVLERGAGPRQLLAAIEGLGLTRPALNGGQRLSPPSHRGPASAEGETIRPPGGRVEPVVGQSPAIKLLRSSINRIAPVPVDVMLVGETGTGKDLLVQQLHTLSGRSGPLVAINCGAIPDTLFESELFGHEAGAFTGAVKGKIGKFEQAELGTLYLDEIESMPLHQQAKLLRVLETRRVDRVGGSSGPLLDLRVVAASQSNLEARCKEGLFRLDLWHRLNVVTLEVPALRHRREDVAALWHFHVEDASRRYGLDAAPLPDACMAQLMAYHWPGNVRELKHAAGRYVLGLKALPSMAAVTADSVGLQAQLAQCERELIEATLQRHNQRLVHTAAELRISEKTLLRRMADYGLRRGSVMG